MEKLPKELQGPVIQRRVVQPLRHLGLVLGLSALPVLVLTLELEPSARRSVLHVAICFAVLMLGFRLLGKRELSRLSPFELVTLMLIPEILSNTLQGESSLLQSLSGLCTILLLVLGTSLLSQRFRVAQAVVESPPSILVRDGIVLESALNAERIAPDELVSEMRKQGILTLQDVRFAVLESGGTITFIPKDPQRQTPSQRDDDAALQ